MGLQSVGCIRARKLLGADQDFQKGSGEEMIAKEKELLFNSHTIPLGENHGGR